MPLWFVSCHSRNDEKISSRLSMTPSPFPPFADLSYSAKARKPFPLREAGCDVKLPKSSVPLSIVPLQLRSNASHASSDVDAVQESLSFVLSLFKSNLTP